MTRAVVQRLLRHASPVMTDRYTHMVENDVRGAQGMLRLVGDEEAKEHG